MKYVDEACAWLIFLAGVTHIVFTEVFHTQNSVLDTGLLYMFVAMFNLLRIRNGDTIKLLKLFCLGATVSALMLEIVRWNMFGRHSSSAGFAVSSLGVAALLLLETIFSITAKP